jgi:hypothetical protein
MRVPQRLLLEPFSQRDLCITECASVLARISTPGKSVVLRYK